MMSNMNNVQGSAMMNNVNNVQGNASGGSRPVSLSA
jgi:hypothetical protein